MCIRRPDAGVLKEVLVLSPRFESMNSYECCVDKILLNRICPSP